jgi:hypothetical protein
MTEGPDGSLARLRARYRAFAEREARGVSPLYQALALGVAESEPLLRFVATLPRAKQQPNLVFAAVRRLYGTPRDLPHLVELVERHPEPIRALALRRSTQTNEPGRCATLVPVLARLPQPLALLEVGAAAGLCLLPDRYAYDYGRVRLAPPPSGASAPPVFPCRANDATPLPDRLPTVAWRAGIDLNPVDLSDPEDVAWLETLVWPGQEERAERLRAAIRIARDSPPEIVRGDLNEKLRSVSASAPGDATLVIFHTAVLAYLSDEARDRFVRQVADMDAVWIGNESPGVLPAVAAKLSTPPPADRNLLSVNGEPVAFTGPHGQSIDWLPGLQPGRFVRPPPEDVLP